jgi:hypothetical protein
MQRSVATLRGLAATPPPPEILHRIRRQTATIPGESGPARTARRLAPSAGAPAGVCGGFQPGFRRRAGGLRFECLLQPAGGPCRVVGSAAGGLPPLGCAPGPSGQRAATAAKRRRRKWRRTSRTLRALGYVAPAMPDSAAKKTAAAAAPAREPAPAPAARLAQAPAPEAPAVASAGSGAPEGRRATRPRRKRHANRPSVER